MKIFRIVSIALLAAFAFNAAHAGDIKLPQYQTLAKAFLAEKVTPAVQVLLGDEDAQGETLRSLAWYWQETAASRRMNERASATFCHWPSDSSRPLRNHLPSCVS